MSIPNLPISGLTALGATPAATDLIEVVDVSDTTYDTTGTNKKVTYTELLGGAYTAGGTDVAVTDGGTGASTAAGARTNLGLVIGTDVEAHDTDLTTIAGLTPTNNDFLQYKAGAWANRTPTQAKTDLAVVPGDITGFDTQVRTSTLNQMTAPTADLSINSHKLTNVTDPSSAQDAATKNYVDTHASLPPTIATKSANYTMTNSDDYIIATSSSITITLQSASTATGKPYTIKNASSGNISFGTTSSQTVDGSTTGTIVPNQSLTVIPSGSSWYIV